MTTTEFTTPGDTDVVAVRRFAAPAALVWRAHTEPEHLRRWMSMPGFPMLECEVDLRVGGRYRHTWSVPDGSSFGFTGTYEELDAPHRLVSTEVYLPLGGEAPAPDHPVEQALNTLELVEEGEGPARSTVLTMTMQYPSAEVRAAVLATGMTDGMGACLDLLDDLLAQGLVPA